MTMKTEQEHNNGQCTIFAQTERSSQIHLEDAEVQPKITQKRSGCVMNNVQWRKVRFDQFFDMLPTNTLSRDKLNNQRGEYQNIHYGDVLIKYPFCLDCNNDDIPYINDDVKFNLVVVRDGDVIFADTAEDDTVGKCVEVLNVGDRKIVSGLHTYFCRPRHKMALGYLGYYLNSNHFHNQLLPYIAGSKVSSVNRTSIARTFISYPADLSTQLRIAAILTSADKVIAATQKTIAKYKQIKQGMMEDLLKPKEGWKKVRLGEFIELQGGFAFQSRDFSDSGVPLIRIGDITPNGLNISNSAKLPTDYLVEYENYVLNINDTVIAMSGATTGKCTLVTQKDLPALLNQRVGRFRIKNNSIDKLFLYYIVSNNVYQQKLLLDAVGGAQPNVSPKQIESVLCYIPTLSDGKPNLTEQRRIAAILMGIDAKIAAEEKVLEKYEKVKKGLMERMLEE